MRRRLLRFCSSARSCDALPQPGAPQERNDLRLLRGRCQALATRDARMREATQRAAKERAFAFAVPGLRDAEEAARRFVSAREEMRDALGGGGAGGGGAGCGREKAARWREELSAAKTQMSIALARSPPAGAASAFPDALLPCSRRFPQRCPLFPLLNRPGSTL